MQWQVFIMTTRALTSLSTTDVLRILFVEIATESDRSRYASSDNPVTQTHQSASAHSRDPVGVTLRSPDVSDMKENVEPSLTKDSHRTSSKSWTQRLPSSKIFTVTGCPRTADREDHSTRQTLLVSHSTEVAGSCGSELHSPALRSSSDNIAYCVQYGRHACITAYTSSCAKLS